MNSVNLLQQFQGCIIGKCVGDALGFVVEGGDQEYCTKYVKNTLKPLMKPQSKGERFFKFGQYSDDSQLARELMISLVENNGFDPEDYSQRIATIFKTNSIVGRGLATEKSANRLISGTPWNESGEPSPYAGNGTAMRVAPIGLYYHKNTKLLEKYAIQQGIITHKDNRCSAGSLIVALTVSFILTHNTINDNELLDFLISKVTLVNKLFALELQNLKAWLKLPFQQVIDKIQISGKPESKSDFWDKISPYVIPTVLCSLYSFLSNKKDYMKSISTAINAGGDVDTTAAITGALSGTYLGVNFIPKVYAKIITDQGGWGYKDMLDLSEQLFNQTEK